METNKMQIAISLLLLALSIAAVPQEPKLSQQDLKCSTNDDCPSDMFCEPRTILSDRCVPRKLNDSECSINRECQSDICDSIEKKCFSQRRAVNQICNISGDCLSGLYCSRRLPLEQNQNVTALQESGETQLRNNGTAKSLIDFVVNRGSATLDAILNSGGVHFEKVANQSLHLSSSGYGVCSYPLKFGDLCAAADECSPGLACVQSVCVIDASVFTKPQLNAWATIGLALAAIFFSLVLVPLVICGAFGWGCFGRGKDRAYPDSTFSGPSMSQRTTL